MAAKRDSSDHSTSGVRISNQQIYEVLLETEKKVDRVDSRIEDVLKPGLDDARARIYSLEKSKADTETTASISGRLEKVEMRVYAIIAGTVAAGGLLNQLGVI